MFFTVIECNYSKCLLQLEQYCSLPSLNCELSTHSCMIIAMSRIVNCTQGITIQLQVFMQITI